MEAQLEFFDSYGEPPETYGFPLNISNLLTAGTAEFQFSRQSLHALGSNICGDYCILFLYIRLAILHTAHVTHSSSSRTHDFATSISILSMLDQSRKKLVLLFIRPSLNYFISTLQFVLPCLPLILG